jgi:hypothetical protein
MNSQTKIDRAIAQRFPTNIATKCYWENGKLVVPYVAGVCDFNKIMDALHDSGDIYTIPDVIEEQTL